MSAIRRTAFPSIRNALIASQSRPFHTSNAARKHYLNATPDVFDKQVIQTSDKNRLVLVDFYADWCGPCKQLSPHLERITSDTNETAGQEVDLVTIDTDAQMELAQRYKIRSLPTVTAFKGGKPLGHFMGAIPPAQLKQILNQWLQQQA